MLLSFWPDPVHSSVILDGLVGSLSRLLPSWLWTVLRLARWRGTGRRGLRGAWLCPYWDVLADRSRCVPFGLEGDGL
jgi:hypothetical protein